MSPPEKRLRQGGGYAPLEQGGTFAGRAEGCGQAVPRAQLRGSSLPVAPRGETRLLCGSGTCCVALGELLSLSVNGFSQLSHGDHDRAELTELS